MITEKISIYGFGALAIIGWILVALKAAGILTWDWGWVAIPFLGALSGVTALAALGFIADAKYSTERWRP